MSSAILNYLQSYNALSIEAKKIIFPSPIEDNTYSLLVIPDDNIEEIIEDTLDDYEGLTDYIDQQLEQMEQMNIPDIFRTLVSHQLLDTDLAEQSAHVNHMDWALLYRTYSNLWEGEPLLDEQLIPSQVHSLLPDLQALREQQEQWIQLPLPAGKEYTAPLMIPMGGFNECPAPMLQASLFQHWQHTYTAIPVMVDESMWILQAYNKPQTDQDALQLAQEHFIFCPYVLESFQSIGEYASYLQEQEYWYFWWD